MSIKAHLQTLADAVKDALDAADQKSNEVTRFEPSRGSVPGDYAWVLPVDTDETRVPPGAFAHSGVLYWEVRIEWHTAGDRQKAADRMTDMMDRTNPDCIQNHLYATALGEEGRLKISGCTWGDKTDGDTGELFVQGRVRGTLSLTEEAEVAP